MYHKQAVSGGVFCRLEFLINYLNNTFFDLDNKLIAERLSVRRIIVGCILAMNDRPTDLYVLILYVSL